MDFVQAIENLDSQLLCKLFVEDKTVLTKVSNCNLYHHLTDTFNSKPKVQQDGAQLVYILSNYGIDINKQDEDGSTAFHQYLYEADFVHPDVVESFLRCNADVFVRNKEGRSIVDKLRQNSLPKNITDLCLRYMPGLWNAVETDDISTVRKLVNQWCKVDIYKEGKSLIQLALDKGTEDVIRIISGIKVSVALAHGVLAGDLQYVKRMTAGPEKYNINFRNMGDRNATPLYYAACQNFTDLITFLPTLGARTDLCMTYREFDIPTYFSIMMEYPVVNAHTLKILLLKKPFSVDKMYYKGRNILFHCIDCDMHPDIIENILQQSSAEIVTQRIQDNMTARDYAVQENCDNAVNIIDKYVSLWCNNEEYSKQKQILLLHGYTAIPKILQEEVNEEEEEYSESVKGYITQIEDFHEAVEMCESEKVKDLMYCDKCKQLQNCLADSRIQAKGQPALHKAVLRKDMKTCCEIAEALVYQCKQKLDSVRDQFFRTALHYAYGMADGKEFVDILMDYGSSDFAVDKDGRSPLAFKDRQELPQMRDLLHYQLLQELETPEPDPWSVRLQMPVVGYLIDCAHSQHKHLPVHMAERLAVELNPIGHSHNSNHHHHHHHHESQSLLVGRQPLMNTTNHREMYSSDGPNQNYADQTNGCIDYEDDSDESSDDDRDEINSSSCNIL
ncbi:uncharacterized protein LOC143079751 [Mytilus galloprovincialis]|uniref:uncharacterized protein LOC143079751 n=1 Tax=Mytilus galloprovincialis TaxID=29158 RepID=UPI003F7CC167